MDKSLIIIVIPGENVRELFGATLENFGEDFDKDIAAFHSGNIECPPVTPNPDFLIIRQIELKPPHFKKLREIFLQFDTLYFAHHQGSGFEKNFSLDDVGTQNRVCFESFHREPKTDRLYQRILNLFQCTAENKVKALRKAKTQLIDCFQVNWELEAKLKAQHQKIECPSEFQISKDTLILWNENEFSYTLTRVVGAGNVAISELDFQAKLPHKEKLLILSELNWRNRCFSQFYGYEFANKLIAKGFELDIAFISCIDRNIVKGINQFTRLLAPIFPHYKLPFEENAPQKISVPDISSTKWSIIRHYYLKPDGIVDKLLHDIKKLTQFTDRKKIAQVLHNIQSYSSVLDADIIEQAKRIEMLIAQNAGYIGSEIRKLKVLLDDFYLKHLSSTKKKSDAPKHPYQIMVVEDDLATLKILSEGLANYFNEVAEFTLGKDALRTLEKDHRAYSALIVDMELLDEEGNWQEIQGSDLIEHAKRYPHLVIYMITAYSKRALANIQEIINLGVKYLSKDATSGLPPELSYQEFTKNLIEEIKKKRKFQEGPKLGSWNKGLLYFYYQVMQTDEGAKLWDEVTQTVDRFITNEEQNHSQLIPPQLFHVDTKEFDLKKLKTVLLHRLVNLYYQYREEGPVDFHGHIRKVLGLQIKNAKQYYNSLLGLSAVSGNSEDDNSTYRIQKKGLFPEEIEWLKKFKPDAHSLKFPKLHQAIADAIDYLPLQVKQKNKKLFSSIETLDDCYEAIKVFSQLPEKSKSDVAVDLADYKENYHHEFELLKQTEEGKKIAALIEEFD